MYLDYINDIKSYYQYLKQHGQLRPRLLAPTPAGIKDECITVVETRYMESDYPLLNSFFHTKTNDKADILKAVKKYDIDAFRSLCYFLNGRNLKTKDLNIELLGWLIDFPIRPYNHATYMRDRAILDFSDTVESSPIQDVITEASSIIIEAQIAPAIEEQVIETASSIDSYPTTLPSSDRSKRLRPQMLLLLIGTALLTSFGLYQITGRGAGVFEKLNDTILDSAIIAKKSGGARCVGATPCNACSNCSQCKWCGAGGTCGACAKPKKSTTTQTRSVQCQATTKKGKQCSRMAKSGTKYCWQHA